MDDHFESMVPRSVAAEMPTSSSPMVERESPEVRNNVAWKDG